MPWQNQGGGGPWGGGGGSGGPWGRGGSGPQPPNLDDLIRQAQERWRRLFPRGPGAGRPGAIKFALIGIAAIWLVSGVYKVQPDEQGVVMRFGEWVATTDPGLHYHLPWPVEAVVKPRVKQVNSIDVGFRSLVDTGRGPKRDVPEESIMLTGDQNIIDIDFTVQWRIKDAGEFLFNIRDPELTVKFVAESAMREIIGRTGIQPALTEARRTIETETLHLVQNVLNEYHAGIEVTLVQLQEVHPPQQVVDAFNDVQRALQDRDRLQNEGEAYRNDVIPRARGEAVKLVQDASAYREKVINEAQGKAQQFTSVYNEYKNAKDVTTKRLYFETMEHILKGAKKFVVTGKEGMAPFLPVPLPPDAPKKGAGQ